MAEYFISIADCTRYNPNSATVTATGFNLSVTRNQVKTVGFYVPVSLLPAGYQRGSFSVSVMKSPLAATVTCGVVNGAGQKIAGGQFSWSDALKDGAGRILIYADVTTTSNLNISAKLTGMGLTVDVPESAGTNLRLGGAAVTGVYLGAEEITGAYHGDNKLF